MLTKYTHKNLVWIDLQSPTKDEVRQVMDEYGIHPLVAEELTTPSLKPKVDLYKNFIYLILHFPSLRRGNPDGTASQEVDFIIGKNFIITARYGVMESLHKFSKIFEVNSILEKSDIGDHAGYLFFFMMKTVYEELIHELDFIKDSIKDIENKIFEGQEMQMVVKISELSRNLLDFKSAMSLHREILQSLEIAGKKFFGTDFDYHMRAILEGYYKIENSILNSSESISELRATNDSLLNAKQNEIMKTITIIAFIFLPVSLITGFFQMNTSSTPVIGTSYDWLIIVSVELFVALILFALAKAKRWL